MKKLSTLSKRLWIGGIQYLCGGLFLLGCLYLGAAFVGSWVQTAEKASPKEGQVALFVLTNGLHTEIAVPLHYANQDWLSKISPDLSDSFSEFRYISLGWGDQAFYLQYKERAYPSLANTCRAMLWPSSSVLHMRFYAKPPRLGERVLRVWVSAAQYQHLCVWLENYFQKDQEGKFELLSRGYGRRDFFFRSHGHYHLFYTCNNWTGEALQCMGIPVGVWTPLMPGLWYPLERKLN